MIQRNGNASPAKEVARSVAELSHDAITLAELQAELVRKELAECRRAALLPVALLAVALVVGLGCVPVLLSSMAYFLAEATQWSLAVSHLASGLVGFVIAGLAGIVGWKLLTSLRLERSMIELRRNADWLKTVLKGRAT